MFHGVIQKITLAQFFETRCISVVEICRSWLNWMLAVTTWTDHRRLLILVRIRRKWMWWRRPQPCHLRAPVCVPVPTYAMFARASRSTAAAGTTSRQHRWTRQSAGRLPGRLSVHASLWWCMWVTGKALGQPDLHGDPLSWLAGRHREILLVWTGTLLVTYYILHVVSASWRQ